VAPAQDPRTCGELRAIAKAGTGNEFGASHASCLNTVMLTPAIAFPHVPA